MPPEGHTRAHSASNRRHALCVSLEATPRVCCMVCGRDVTALARERPAFAGVLETVHNAAAKWDSPSSVAPPAAAPGKGKGTAKGKSKELSKAKGKASVKKGAGRATGNGGGGRAFPGVCGLRNLGNSCFLNALVQCLAHSPRVAEAFTAKDALRQGTTTDALAAAIRGVLERDTTRGPYSPGDLLTALASYSPRFRARRSQDAHEALAALFDLVDREQRREPAETEKPVAGPAPRSVVDDLFQGCVTQKVRCRACGYESTTHQPFLCLPLSFPPQFLPRVPQVDTARGAGAGAAAAKPTTTTTTTTTEPEKITAPDSASVEPLPDLRERNSGSSSSSGCGVEAFLRCFTDPHELRGDEQYLCAACTLRRAGRTWEGDAGDVTLGTLPRVYANATKQCVLARLPPVLVLQLVRFQGFGARAAKIALPVAVPTALDVAAFVGAECATSTAYRLTGVAEHRGALSHGHYTATLAHPDAAHWYHCSDTTVIAVAPPGPVLDSTDAYILFYERIEAPPAEPTLAPPPPSEQPQEEKQEEEKEKEKEKEKQQEQQQEKREEQEQQQKEQQQEDI